MAVYNIHEAKTQLSKLVARVEAGEEIVIARNGAPVAKLMPMVAPARPKRVFGQLEGLMSDDEIDALFSPEAEAEIQAMFDEALNEPLWPEDFENDKPKSAAE